MTRVPLRVADRSENDRLLPAIAAGLRAGRYAPDVHDVPDARWPRNEHATLHCTDPALPDIRFITRLANAPDPKRAVDAALACIDSDGAARPPIDRAARASLESLLHAAASTCGVKRPAWLGVIAVAPTPWSPAAAMPAYANPDPDFHEPLDGQGADLVPICFRSKWISARSADGEWRPTILDLSPFEYRLSPSAPPADAMDVIRALAEWSPKAEGA